MVYYCLSTACYFSQGWTKIRSCSALRLPPRITLVTRTGALADVASYTPSMSSVYKMLSTPDYSFAVPLVRLIPGFLDYPWLDPVSGYRTYVLYGRMTSPRGGRCHPRR